jgi:hypothetical protein
MEEEEPAAAAAAAAAAVDDVAPKPDPTEHLTQQGWQHKVSGAGCGCGLFTEVPRTNMNEQNFASSSMRESLAREFLKQVRPAI